MESQDKQIVKQPHHERDQLCTTRPPYRQGKKLTAVKVYTVNDESQHLLIRGVPALNLQKELKNLCMRYGEVKLIHQVKNYSEDEEQFTEVFHVLYARIQSARFAKHMIDDKSFFGGVLHVCYAPESETLTETKHKLDQRKYDVTKRIRQYKADELRKEKYRKQSAANPHSVDGDADYLCNVPSGHYSSISEPVPGSSGVNYPSSSYNEPVPGSSRINYTPKTHNNFTPNVNHKPSTTHSRITVPSHQSSQVPNKSKKSFPEAGLLSYEFIPRQTPKTHINVDSNSSNSATKSNSTTQDGTTGVKRSTTMKLAGKFIPPQVKRIKFN